MIEKIAGIAEIGRQASSGNISPRRLELYLKLERCVPGGLTLLRNDAGYFVLCRMGRGYAGNASTVVEHFFVYRDGASFSRQIDSLGDEATLIRLASQLEAHQPWAARLPTVHAVHAATLSRL